MKKFLKILVCLMIIVVIGLLIYLGINYTKALTDEEKNPVVTMEIEGYGTVKIELYPDMAPNTVKNFIKLAQRGYYDGKTFSEIEDGLIKGGFDLSKENSGEEVEGVTQVGVTTNEPIGPTLSDIKDLAEGESDTSYSIKGEFVQNGFDGNTLSHQRGVISMDRTTALDYQEEIVMIQQLSGLESYLNYMLEMMNDSQGSGFFIMTKADTSYDGLYTAFGKVIEGMDVVDKIASAEVNEDTNAPVIPPVINKVTVETYGVEYGVPETVEYFDFDANFKSIISTFVSQQEQ